MNIKKNVIIQGIKDSYQYGNISFIEAVQRIMDTLKNKDCAEEEAIVAIKQIGKIILPYSAKGA